MASGKASQCYSYSVANLRGLSKQDTVQVRHRYGGRLEVENIALTVERGYIKLHRTLTEHPIYRCPIKSSIWSHLLLSATHKPHKTRLGASTITLQPGQLITGRRQILRDCFDQVLVKVTEDHVRGALKYMQREGMIDVHGTRKGSIITITNWSKYQTEVDEPAENLDCFEQCLVPPHIPNISPPPVPPHETGLEATEYMGFMSSGGVPISPEVFHDSPAGFPTIQEYKNTELSKDNSIPQPPGYFPMPGQRRTLAAASEPLSSYPPKFEQVWKLWKELGRKGRDDKQAACLEVVNRIGEGHTVQELLNGVKRYFRYCQQRGSIGSCYIMTAARFFGSEKKFTDHWGQNTGPAKPSGQTRRAADYSSSDQGKTGQMDRREARAKVTAAVMNIEDTDW